MTGSIFGGKWDADDVKVAVFVACLVIGAAVVLFAALRHRAPDTALVLATDQDCLRAFDAAACEKIVASAFAIHARTAPSFYSAQLCEMNFGAGGCRAVKDSVFGDGAYAPKVAAVVAARNGDQRDLLPVYFGPHSASDQGPRRVYYRGVAVGTLAQDRFGGAQISRLVDLKGAPITSATVRKLRRG